MSGNARLYNKLDVLYRELWGPSLHHGLWLDGKESPHQARHQLATHNLYLLGPADGDTLADIGCGYGALSHRIATSTNCQVHACTNSAAQINASQKHRSIHYHHGDWLSHPLPPNSLDKAIALESLSHFPEWDAFFSTTSRVLKHNSRLVVSDWFAAPNCSALEKRLLQHLAQTGAIPNWRPFSEMLSTAKDHSLQPKHHDNLSSGVAPTWTAFFRSASLAVFTKPKLLPPLIKTALHRPSLLISFPLLRLAYHLGILEYHLCVFQKASEKTTGGRPVGLTRESGRRSQKSPK